MSNKKWSAKWEKIDWETMRLKVHGGWVLNHVTDNGKMSDTSEHQMVAESSCFISDPEHKWTL